jgi:hypothetical protein
MHYEKNLMGQTRLLEVQQISFYDRLINKRNKAWTQQKYYKTHGTRRQELHEHKMSNFCKFHSEHQRITHFYIKFII